MKHLHKSNYFILALFEVFFFIFFPPLLTGGGARTARAAASASSVVTAYEQSNVLDDLENSTIDGNAFDLNYYNFDEKKNTQLLSFVEFGYSYRTDRQQDYGLYAYVYNPKGLDYDKTSISNKITLRYAEKSKSEFTKYNLIFLNESTRGGYEGLFYKFKIDLPDNTRADILSLLNSNARIYEVSEIELLIKNDVNATSYNVSKKYSYAGYAEGYGSAVSSGDSLICTSEGTTTLTLNVYPATYRPEGTNGKNNFTQDSLDSVYFAIPNEIIEEYGGLSAVHATWLNVLTMPIFVTGNKDIYDALYPIVWEYYGSLSEASENGLNFDYCLGVNAHNYQSEEWNADLYYGDTPTAFNGIRPSESQIIKNIYYLFYAESGNADDYELKGSEILNYIQSYTDNLHINPDPVAGKYWANLFQEVDDEYTDIDIHADDKYSLTSEKLSQNWWQKLLGVPGSEVENRTTFNGIEAVHKVVASDFKDTFENTCKALYIGESYYSDFKSFYDKSTQQNETVYLFRYYQSDFQNREVTEFTYGSLWGVPKSEVNKIDSNGYYAQEWLHLDFDIIDVTCSKGNVNTVIGAVSSPQDIAPNVTPPVFTTPESKNWIKIILTVVFTVILIVLVIWLVFKLIDIIRTKKE